MTRVAAVAPARQPGWLRRATPRLAGRSRAAFLATLAIAVGFAAWVAFALGGAKPESGPAAVAATVPELRTLPQQTGHAVYWAGTQGGGYAFELTRAASGNVFIRYLPASVEIGTRQPDYLTVGSYPRRNASRGLQALARKPGWVAFDAPAGGLAVYERTRPSSIYLAHPSRDVQVEVYHPSPADARRLVRRGQINPLG